MLHHLAGATIQVAKCEIQEDGNKPWTYLLAFEAALLEYPLAFTLWSKTFAVIGSRHI